MLSRPSPVPSRVSATLVTLALLVGCAAPSTPAEPVVAVEMMAATQNPRLGSPDSDREATALYGSGCTWVTRDGTAVVCFTGAGGPEVAMTVLRLKGAAARRYPLYTRAAGVAAAADADAGRDGPPYRKHPDFAAASAWLAAHRLQRSDNLDIRSVRFSPDGRRFTVRGEDKHWGAPVPGLPRRLVPSDWQPANRAACCATKLRRVVVPPLGSPVALVQASCKVTPATHACQSDAATPCPAPTGCATYAKAGPRAGGLHLLLIPLRAKPRAADAKPPKKTAADLAAERLRAGPAAIANKDGVVPEAPARFTVAFTTTRGTFKVQLVRAWAPHGVDRFHALVAAGFFHDIAFFRVIPGFMAQFGVHGDPQVASAWASASIPDDPVNPARASNQRGYLTFAKAGPNTRSTQLFISFRDNSNLDRMGFPPIGRVLGNGMAIVDQLYGGYGEGAPRGKGPDQGTLQSAGNTYLRKAFPRLDYVRSIKLVP